MPKKPKAEKVPVALQRPRSERVFAAAFGVAFGLLALVNLPAAFRHGGALVPEALVLLGAFVCLRVIRVRCTAGEEGLAVRNYLRTHRLDWAAVRAITADPPVSKLDSWRILVVPEQGRPFGIDASRRAYLRAPSRGPDDDRKEVDALRRQLQAWMA
ncbi:MAG TPA: PH domain-containing protein [Actinomycetota bacterium]|nr:PH domain-containing protein [Actinomycetota bacterium]